MACSMAAGELSLRPCFPFSNSSSARSLVLAAEGESCPVGVVAPGEVIAEDGDVRAVEGFPPGEGHGWELDVGEAVLLLPPSRCLKSWTQWRVASTAAPTVNAMTVVSDRLWGDILQALEVRTCYVRLSLADSTFVWMTPKA